MSAEAILDPAACLYPGLQDHKSFTSGQNKGRDRQRGARSDFCLVLSFAVLELFSEVNVLARHYQLQWFGSEFCSRLFVLLTFGSTLHWLCFESYSTHINV